MAELHVVNSSAQLEYQLMVGELVGGSIRYSLEEGRVVLRHTEVDRTVVGRGLGSRLISGALDDIRARGLAVVPLCPFVRAYLERHPEYADLVAAAG